MSNRPLAFTFPNSEPTRGPGAPSLVDGLQQVGTELENACWLAFHETDLDATIDLGKATAIHTLVAHSLQQKGLGIYLPKQVEFAVSDDAKTFRIVATLAHDVPKSEPRPLMRSIAAENLDLAARYVRVRAEKTGTAGRDWLFVDEILVNPSQ